MNAVWQVCFFAEVPRTLQWHFAVLHSLTNQFMMQCIKWAATQLSV